MAEKNKGIFDFDMTQFDVSKFDMTKILSEFKVPGVDVDQLIAVQKKNIEALTQANKMALQGFRTATQRQAEFLRAAFGEAAQVASQIAQTESISDKVAKQAEFAKEGMQKALANMREVSEVLTKSNTEAFELLSDRVREGITEVTKLVEAKSAPAAGHKRTAAAA